MRGVVQQVGSPLDLYQPPGQPLRRRLHRLAQDEHRCRSRYLQTSDDGVTIAGDAIDSTVLSRSAQAIARGDRLTLGLRPQAFVPSATGSIKGHVELVERLGHETIIRVRLRDGSDIMAALQGQSDVMPGDEFALGFDHNQAHLFDQNGTRL